MDVAFVIGHDKVNPGAYSLYLSQSEYIYHSEVAPYLAQMGDIYKRPLGGGYKTQMRKLSEEVNKKHYDLVVELHFNAYDKRANGTETVIYRGNGYTQQIGEQYCEAVCREYGTENRGVKEVLEPNDRGYWFLHLMKAPAIILEPFFGDNEEALKFKNPGKYADVIKTVICG